MTNNVNYLKKKFVCRKTCYSKTLKNYSNCVKKKRTFTEKSNRQWQLPATYNHILENWTKNSNVNRNYSTTQNIKFSWWNVKWLGLGEKRPLRRRRIWRKRLIRFKRSMMLAVRIINYWLIVWRNWKRILGLLKKHRIMSSCRKISIKRLLKLLFWKMIWRMLICKESPNRRKKF